MFKVSTCAVLISNVVSFISALMRASWYLTGKLLARHKQKVFVRAACNTRLSHFDLIACADGGEEYNVGKEHMVYRKGANMSYVLRFRATSMPRR